MPVCLSSNDRFNFFIFNLTGPLALDVFQSSRRYDSPLISPYIYRQTTSPDRDIKINCTEFYIEQNIIGTFEEHLRGLVGA